MKYEGTILNLVVQVAQLRYVEVVIQQQEQDWTVKFLPSVDKSTSPSTEELLHIGSPVVVKLDLLGLSAFFRLDTLKTVLQLPMIRSFFFLRCSLLLLLSLRLRASALSPLIFFCASELLVSASNSSIVKLNFCNSSSLIGMLFALSIFITSGLLRAYVLHLRVQLRHVRFCFRGQMPPGLH